MFRLEQSLYDQLSLLRDKYHLQGIKAEFEAEGSSFNDLVRLRRITGKAEVDLYLKIGGVEAMSDITNSVEIGVDGLIAPMVESKFGAHKFYESYARVYKDHRIHLSLNIETKNAVDQIDEIIEFSNGKFDNITIGRSDLSGSYFDEGVFPDSDFVMGAIRKIGAKLESTSLSLTVGGDISAKTIEILKGDRDLTDKILRLETRKVILPTKDFLSKDNAIREAMKFEQIYIRSKREISDVRIERELAWLTQQKAGA